MIITWFHPDLSSARDDRQTSSSAVWNIIDFLIMQFIEFPAVRLLGNRNPLIPLMFEWVKDQVTIVSDVKPADQSKCSCTATNDLTINKPWNLIGCYMEFRFSKLYQHLNQIQYQQNNSHQLHNNQDISDDEFHMMHGFTEGIIQIIVFSLCIELEAL
ncbi:MAG: hypothetical protein SOZ08_06910 [Erysipelotrichaceae bacterium]|nr:hypothetical protein [Erysipelotrichaceae bacterium]